MSFGDFLKATIALPVALFTGGATTAGAVLGGSEGAKIGAGLDILGLAIGAGLAAGMAGEAAAADIGTEAATADIITSGGAQSATAVGAPEVASTTEQLAQGTLAGES